MNKDKTAALLSLALTPKVPPKSLKDSILRAVAAPPLELRDSHGLVSLDHGVARTGAGARAELRIRGQALIALNENTRATLRRGARGLELLLEAGGAMVHVVKNTAFSVQLPLGLIEVKGTWFYAESRGPKESYVCLCEGKLWLSAGGLRKVMKSRDHVAVTLAHRKGKPTLSKAPTLHWHPDTGPVG
ncbi:MAG TPA: FecR family protein [bacterium]|jgi:ferric-dicitrate binding protein FerR (iron transport regulator)|nr:FecR family protein [bacterium]